MTTPGMTTTNLHRAGGLTTTPIDVVPDMLRLRCPSCSRSVRVPFMVTATWTGYRTCRKCRRQWWIVATPSARRSEGVWVHLVSWTLTEVVR